ANDRLHYPFAIAAGAHLLVHAHAVHPHHVLGGHPPGGDHQQHRTAEIHVRHRGGRRLGGGGTCPDVTECLDIPDDQTERILYTTPVIVVEQGIGRDRRVRRRGGWRTDASPTVAARQDRQRGQQRDLLV